MFINSSRAEDSVAGRSCDRTKDFSIMQCDSSNSFINYTCQHPDWLACTSHYKAAIDKSSACENAFGIFDDIDDCGLPVANPHVDTLDKELAEDFAEIEAECIDGGGKSEACCRKISAARSCSNEVIRLRTVFETCRGFQYIYKNSFPNSLKCGGCVPGKILESGDLCYNDGLPPSNDNPSATEVVPDDSNLPPATSESELTLLEKFKAALIANRPKAEDFPPDVPGLREGSDISRLVGNPIPDILPGQKREQIKLPDGTIVYDFSIKGQVSEQQDYIMKLRDFGGNPKFILPDGTVLQGAYANRGMQIRIPVGTKIITPPDGRVVFEIKGERYYGNSMVVQMEGSSEVSLDIVTPKLAKVQATKGFIRFQKNPTPLQSASPTFEPVSKEESKSEAVKILEEYGAPQWFIEVVDYLNFTDERLTGYRSRAYGATKGTDFGVKFDEESGKAIFEIYDGALEVGSSLSGASTTISSVYGLDIKRVEVDQEGIMKELTAIPQSEWEKFLADNVIKSDQPLSNKSVIWLVLVLILVGGGYALYKKGIFGF